MKHFKLDVNGSSYSCVEEGEGPLLLLGHGTFGGKRLLLPQLNHLRRFYRCVAFDWRGHGETGYDPGGWTADDLVEDVVALIGKLGEERAIVAGVSQGGAIGMRVALAYPDKVRALVNMCGGPGGPPPAVTAVLDEFAESWRGSKMKRCAAKLQSHSLPDIFTYPASSNGSRSASRPRSTSSFLIRAQALGCCPGYRKAMWISAPDWAELPVPR